MECQPQVDHTDHMHACQCTQCATNRLEAVNHLVRVRFSSLCGSRSRLSDLSSCGIADDDVGGPHYEDNLEGCFYRFGRKSIKNV